MITFSTKMADLVFTDVFALSILERLNISLGFGDKTVGEICDEKKIDPDLFLNIARLFFYGEAPTNPSNNRALLPSLIEYLKITHQYYINNQIPQIESYIKELEKNELERKHDISLLRKFFNIYKTEFLEHINNEENNVFPYVIQLYNAIINKNLNQDIIDSIEKNSISTFEKEHDSLDEKLNDLRSIIIKYLQPFKSKTLIYQILIVLYQLEKDVFEHGQLEDLMLIPVVAEIENEIKALIN